MGPQNGLIDENFGTGIPVTDVPDKDLEEEKKMAKFSKSKEWQKLKEYFDSRIEFYQKYLPNGQPIGDAKPDLNNWTVANLMITEFQSVISTYENAEKAVKNVGRNN